MGWILVLDHIVGSECLRELFLQVHFSKAKIKAVFPQADSYTGTNWDSSELLTLARTPSLLGQFAPFLGHHPPPPASTAEDMNLVSDNCHTNDSISVY